MKIIAHRGASFTAPENTLASFRLGLEQGADGIELDVRLTADGQVIALHDSDTGRTADINCVVCDTSYDIICTLDAGSWKCDEFKCERIPLLSEVFQILPVDREIYIEIKCGDEIIAPLSELLSHFTGLTESVVLFGFDYDTMVRVRHTMPSYRTMWIGEFGYNIPISADMYDTAERMIKEGGFSGFSTKADRKHVAVMRERLKGMMLNVWTVDDADEAAYYKSINVTSVTTNRPDLIIANL